MPELAEFQDGLAHAIRTRGPAAPGLAVYRNTVANGLREVLAANYPTVERLVGEDCFAACADAYAAEYPPANPVLSLYGEGFARFLTTFEPAADLPYLAHVARIDRMWTEAHFAPDADVLDPAQLQAQGGEALLEMRLALHPATRIAWFEAPAPTIWRLNRPPAPLPGPDGFDIDWRAEGVALARPYGEVKAIALDAARFAFLTACDQGRTLGAGFERVLEIAPDTDLPGALGQLLAAGVFAAPSPSKGPSDG